MDFTTKPLALLLLVEIAFPYLPTRAIEVRPELLRQDPHVRNPLASIAARRLASQVQWQLPCQMLFVRSLAEVKSFAKSLLKLMHVGLHQGLARSRARLLPLVPLVSLLGLGRHTQFLALLFHLIAPEAWCLLASSYCSARCQVVRTGKVS
jgi:hypothetical protein